MIYSFILSVWNDNVTMKMLSQTCKTLTLFAV